MRTVEKNCSEACMHAPIETIINIARVFKRRHRDMDRYKILIEQAELAVQQNCRNLVCFLIENDCVVGDLVSIAVEHDRIDFLWQCAVDVGKTQIVQNCMSWQMITAAHNDQQTFDRIFALAVQYWNPRLECFEKCLLSAIDHDNLQMAIKLLQKMDTTVLNVRTIIRAIQNSGDAVLNVLSRHLPQNIHVQRNRVLTCALQHSRYTFCSKLFQRKSIVKVFLRDLQGFFDFATCTPQVKKSVHIVTNSQRNQYLLSKYVVIELALALSSLPTLLVFYLSNSQINPLDNCLQMHVLCNMIDWTKKAALIQIAEQKSKRHKRLLV